MSHTLHQFAFSHFNEKARWALAFKGVICPRRTYLPGPHMPAIRKLSGQAQTPVLETGDTIVCGSANIIEHLEQTHPEPSLYPKDSELRETALKLQTDMDRELGPAVRTVVFSALVNEGGYLTRMFAGSKNLPTRALYRATFPLARGLIAKGNGVDDPANIRACFKQVHTWLDHIATVLDGRPYLVDNRFCVADLCAAALLAPIASVEHVDMKRPQPVPESVAAIIDQYAAHPTITWVRETYRQHRPD